MPLLFAIPDGIEQILCSGGSVKRGSEASHKAKLWEETKDPSIIWEGHYAGIEEPYCQIEKLQNLEQLPDTGCGVV